MMALQGATGSPVAVICPVTEAWDTVDVTNNDTSDILTTMTISNAAYIWTNYTAGQPFILCGNPSSRVPLTGETSYKTLQAPNEAIGNPATDLPQSCLAAIDILSIASWSCRILLLV